MATDATEDAAAQALLAEVAADDSPGMRLLSRYLLPTKSDWWQHLLLMPIYFGIAIFRLLEARRTGEWQYFWIAALGVAPLLIGIVAFWIAGHYRDLLLPAAIVWRAASGPDETQAPPAYLQPAPFSPEEQRLASPTVKQVSWADPFTVRMRKIGDPLKPFVYHTAFIGIALGAVFDPQMREWFPLLFVVGVLPFDVYVSSRQLSQWAIADSEGLHFRQALPPRREAVILWTQIRSFTVMYQPVLKWQAPQPHYWLSIDQGLIITWGATDDGRGRAAIDPQTRRDHEWLARAVVTYTGLPLRDVTGASVALDAMIARARGKAPTTTKVPQPGIPVELHIPGLERAIQIEQERVTRQRNRWLWLAATPLILFAGIYAVGAVLFFVR